MLHISLHCPYYLFQVKKKRGKVFKLLGIYFADPEEGVGNSHAALGKLPVPIEVPGEEAKSPTAEDVQLPMGEGEKSVLQAKLTNLAIQIGYAGKQYRLSQKSW